MSTFNVYSFVFSYSAAISKLSTAMTNVKHVLKKSEVISDPAVKHWAETEESQFVLRPRKSNLEIDGRRGSSSSWYLA